MAAGGSITVIYGPVESGKTYLIRDITTKKVAAEDAPRKTVFGIVHAKSNPPHDIPDKENSKTLIPQGDWKISSVVTATRLKPVVIPTNTTSVAIDDGHLFPDVYEMSSHWARMGFDVIVAMDSPAPTAPTAGALNLTIGALLAESEGIVRLVCKCQCCSGPGAVHTIDAGHPSLEVPFDPSLKGPIHVCRRCANVATGRLYK